MTIVCAFVFVFVCKWLIFSCSHTHCRCNSLFNGLWLRLERSSRWMIVTNRAVKITRRIDFLYSHWVYVTHFVPFSVGNSFVSFVSNLFEIWCVCVGLLFSSPFFPFVYWFVTVLCSSFACFLEIWFYEMSHEHFIHIRRIFFGHLFFFRTRRVMIGQKEDVVNSCTNFFKTFSFHCPPALKLICI